MGSTRRWRRVIRGVKPRRRSPYRLFDVLGAVTHLEFAEVPLQFAEDVVLAEIFIVHLDLQFFAERLIDLEREPVRPQRGDLDAT